MSYAGLFSVPLNSFLFKVHMFKKNIFWINFDEFGKNFVILRVYGQNMIDKCYLNACVISRFSFLICMARR